MIFDQQRISFVTHDASTNLRCARNKRTRRSRMESNAADIASTTPAARQFRRRPVSNYA
jgi:hypothetical protein